jgi:hypothetical protein
MRKELIRLGVRVRITGDVYDMGHGFKPGDRGIITQESLRNDEVAYVDAEVGNNLPPYGWYVNAGDMELLDGDQII